MFTACKKKEAPAVIEEVPAAAAAPVETDTTATLAEEPSLKQIGKNAKPGKEAKPGSAKATFHPSAAADKAGFSEQGHFVVQVSIFKSKRQAAALVEKLANAGFPAYVAEVENPTPALSGTWHRVRIGKFMKVADAKAFGDNTLSGMGYQYWVDNKKNDAVGGDGSSAAAPEVSPAPARTSRHSRSKAAAAAAPVAEMPITSPSEPAAPSEPSAPSSETWGNPKTSESATPSSEPAATTPTPKSSSAPASKSPADTGKVNLDEW